MNRPELACSELVEPAEGLGAGIVGRNNKKTRQWDLAR